MRHWINLIAEKQQQLYLRFGEIPENERSGIGASPTWIHHLYRTSDEEEGVSVYWVEWKPDTEQWQINDCGNYATLDALIAAADEGKRKMYIVTGDLQPEHGMDGEPLLRNVKIVSEVDSVKSLIAPGFFDGKEVEKVNVIFFSEMTIFYPDGSEKRESEANGSTQITDHDLDEWLGWATSYNPIPGTFEGEKAILYRQAGTNHQGEELPVNVAGTEAARQGFGLTGDMKLRGIVVVMKNHKVEQRHV